jgi:hypothetical protein
VIIEEPGAAPGRVREADLTRHLGNSQDKEAEKNGRAKPAATPAAPAERPEADRARHQEEFQLQAGARVPQGRAGAEEPRPRSRKPRPGEKGELISRQSFPRHFVTERPTAPPLSRHILLDEVGIEGQQRCDQPHALIFGAGGLGCPAALYLAASGIGQTDAGRSRPDDLTNLQRQILYPHGFDRQTESRSGAGPRWPR